jgi:hypothetical protein
VDAVPGEEGVVRELVGAVGKQPVHGLAAAELLLRLRPHLVAVPVHPFAEKASDRQVHRMIGGDAIHSPDVNLLLEEPRHHVGMGARVIVVVQLLVGRAPEVRVLVPPGVQKQPVSLSHLHPLLDHLRRVEPELVHLVAQIDDDAGAAQPFERQLVDRLSRGDEMAGRVDVRAHVIRRLDVLRVDAVLRLPLDVFHLEGRIVRPERAAFVERLRQIVEFHRAHTESGNWVIG